MTDDASIPDTVVVAVVQMPCTANKQENVDKALTLIADAAEQGANIIVLQELFATLYPCQSEDHDRFADAEPIPGPTSQRLQNAAGDHRVVIVGSLFERRAPGVYHNTAVVFDANGRGLGLYRKMHIPDDPLYYEKFYFTPVFAAFPRNLAAWASACAGTSGFPRPRG
jgi:N-carbamoylputrescine amidase